MSIKTVSVGLWLGTVRYQYSVCGSLARDSKMSIKTVFVGLWLGMVRCQ